MTDEDKIKEFFRNTIEDVKKITLQINIPNLKAKLDEELIEDDKKLLNSIALLKNFLINNTSLLDGDNSFFKEWKLITINPLLPKEELTKLFKELNVFDEGKRLIVFETDDLFYYLVGYLDDKLKMNFYYIIETDSITNLKKDIASLQDKEPSIFSYQETNSTDITLNSFLYPILLRKYYYLFPKQDSETYDLILEISKQFIETFSERREYKTISIIALIAIIIESNLIKIYSKHNGKRPPEKLNINGLNSSIAKNETVELRLISGNNYQLIYKTSSNKPYTKKDRIYWLVQDFANNIRNKVFHYQQSSTLNLFYTSVHALRYFVNILMEIEDNGYL